MTSPAPAPRPEDRCGPTDTAAAFFAAIAKEGSDATGARPGDLILSFLSGSDVLSLRLASRAVCHVVDRVLPRLFGTLTLECRLPDAAIPPVPPGGIGIHCRNLKVRILSATAPASTDCSSRSCDLYEYAHAPDVGSFEWLEVFKHFPHVTCLTVGCIGVPAWPGYSPVERCLVDIRQALESSTFLHLKKFSVDPIHAIGVLHLRWAGGGAYGSANETAGTVWGTLRHLDIGLVNPAGELAKDHQNMFVKVLHDYLGSFCDSLEQLGFRWIGSTGPNPLFLEEASRGRKTGLTAFSAPPLTWRTLKAVDLQNTDLQVGQVKALFGERAASLDTFTFRGRLRGQADHPSAELPIGIRWNSAHSPDISGATVNSWIFRASVSWRKEGEQGGQDGSRHDDFFGDVDDRKITSGFDDDGDDDDDDGFIGGNGTLGFQGAEHRPAVAARDPTDGFDDRDDQSESSAEILIMLDTLLSRR